MSPIAQAWAITVLAHTRVACGQPRRAANLYRRGLALFEQLGHDALVAAALVWLAPTLRKDGLLREAEASARRALPMMQRTAAEEGADAGNEADVLRHLGLTLATRGSPHAEAAFARALRLCGQELLLPRSQVCLDAAQHALWRGQIDEAAALAEEAGQLAQQTHVERNQGRAVLVRGLVALAREASGAEGLLHLALTQARSGNFTEEEVVALMALAELRRRQGELAPAHALLEDVWEPVERGPYPLLQADALNALARVERDAGNRPAAVGAATRAYRLAWCDGPPFAYHWGLEAARGLLLAIGGAEPDDLLPHAETSHEPLPHIDFDAMRG